MSIDKKMPLDHYQITMAYAYWKSSKINDHAVFDIFFRKNPFDGEFAIFAGLEECLKFLKEFSYSETDIEYLKETLTGGIEKEFFNYLQTVNAKGITVYALREGTVCFPKMPLMRIEGPLVVIQLVETTLLNLINFASLVATNAARYRLAAGNGAQLFEFGLREGQGPNGGLSASKYCYLGGFDGTSNVLAGKWYGIPVKGAPTHGYVTSFGDVTELPTVKIVPKNGGESKNLTEIALFWRKKIIPNFERFGFDPDNAELAALLSYAAAFPNNFLVSVDSTDVKRSGLINFTAVAMALDDLGYRPVGIRIDSGNLLEISSTARTFFKALMNHYDRKFLSTLVIMAAGDINEETLYSLKEQHHNINWFGIGTSLVTCKRQPALGGVCKLVEINGDPRIKLSQDVAKVTIPGKKNVYRLYGKGGRALMDLMQKDGEEPPRVKQKILCRHPFDETKRAYVFPSKVENLLIPYWRDGVIFQTLPSLNDVRKYVRENLKRIRCDVKRNFNPTPYKVAVSDELYNFLHEIWMQNAPIGELN